MLVRFDGNGMIQALTAAGEASAVAPQLTVDPRRRSSGRGAHPPRAGRLLAVFPSRIGAARMERLWSPAGATVGNQRQIARPRNARKLIAKGSGSA